MENYIVRIYRRDASDPNRVAGMLESVEAQTQHPFNTLVALRSLLLKQSPAEPADKKIKSAAIAE